MQAPVTSGPLPPPRRREIWIATALWVVVAGLFLLVAQALAAEIA